MTHHRGRRTRHQSGLQRPHALPAPIDRQRIVLVRSAGDRRQAVTAGQRRRIEYSRPAIPGVRIDHVARIVDRCERASRSAITIRRRELGGHRCGRIVGTHTNDACAVDDGAIGARIFENCGPTRGRWARGRSPVHLARVGVTRLGVRVTVLREAVRTRGHRLRAQRVDARTTGGVTPRSGRLARHHATQVLLDRDIVDRSLRRIRSTRVGRNDRAAVVADRSVGLTHAECGVG